MGSGNYPIKTSNDIDVKNRSRFDPSAIIGYELMKFFTQSTVFFCVLTTKMIPLKCQAFLLIMSPKL